jgi:hypothetical protein
MSPKMRILVAAAVATVIIGGIAAFILNNPDIAGPSAVNGDITRASGEAASSKNAQNEGAYEPSSEWREEGIELDVQKLSFSESDYKAPEGAPEMLTNYHIQSVMQQNQRPLLECYAEQLHDHPDLAGQVYFDFAVAPDGHVVMVKVASSELRSKPTEDCFVERAKAWEFPATQRDVLTRFQTDFNFRAN